MDMTAEFGISADPSTTIPKEIHEANEIKCQDPGLSSNFSAVAAQQGITQQEACTNALDTESMQIRSKGLFSVLKK